MKKIYIVFFLILLLVGCNNVKTTDNVITDTATLMKLPIKNELKSGEETYHYGFDTMDRGNHDFVNKSIIIDTNIDNLVRGNVVVIGKNENLIVSRVIGLPGEDVKVEGGQVYINGKKLKTFYGKAHRLGMTKKEYFDFVKKSKMEEIDMEDIFDMNIESTTLNKNEYYLIGDDWLRSEQRKVNINEIKGKVVGFFK